MKIGTSSSFKTTVQVHIPRVDSEGFNLMVTSLPLSFSRTAERICPTPKPTHKLVRDNGKPIKDDQGRPLKAPDFEDPEYKEALNKSTTLQSIFIFWLAVKDDPNVSFDTEVKGNEPTQKQLESLMTELDEAGITFGDINIVIKEAMSISNLDLNNLGEAEGQ